MSQIEFVEPATAEDPLATETASEVVDTAEIKDGKVVVKFSKTEAALATLRAKYSGPVPDVTTKPGMELARAGRAAMTAVLNALEERRTELKKPALVFGRTLDAEAKRIEAEIETLRQPYAEAIDAEKKKADDAKAAKERAEQQRIREHEVALRGITEMPGRYVSAPSKEIQFAIEQLEDPEFCAGRVWEEYAEEARDSVRQTLMTLRAHLENAKAREELASIRAQQQVEERNRAAEQTRVAKIKDRIRALEMAPQTCIGLASPMIGRRIDALQEDADEGFESFAEFSNDARAAMDTAIGQLRRMKTEATESEAAATARAAEQAELQRLRDADSARQREAIDQANREARERAEAEQRQRDAELAALKRVKESAGSILSALQVLVKVVRRMDAEVENDRPSDEEYQAALIAAEQVIAEATGAQS